MKHALIENPESLLGAREFSWILKLPNYQLTQLPNLRFADPDPGCGGQTEADRVVSNG
jgi:hypothetical protein